MLLLFVGFGILVPIACLALFFAIWIARGPKTDIVWGTLSTLDRLICAGILLTFGTGASIVAVSLITRFLRLLRAMVLEAERKDEALSHHD